MIRVGELKRQVDVLPPNTPILLETVGGYVTVDFRYQNGVHKTLTRDCSRDEMMNGDDVNALVFIPCHTTT